MTALGLAIDLAILVAAVALTAIRLHIMVVAHASCGLLATFVMGVMVVTG
jgi:hypothetical protein